MNLKTLRTFETRHRFAYPPLYLQMAQNGFLDFGQTGAGWFAQEFPKLKACPPLLLYGDDFELIDGSRIAEELDSQHDPDSCWDVREDYLFAPFAQNGAGDLYCFFYDRSAPEAEPPVVLLWHDCDQADILADNLQAFLLRALLESVAHMNPDTSLWMADGWREQLAAYSATHRPYLAAAQENLLADIFRREQQIFETGEERETGLLSRREIEQILSRQPGFARSGESFPYQAEREYAPPPERECVNGTLHLEIAPPPAQGSSVYAALKALNWKQDKRISNALHYLRNVQQYICPDVSRKQDYWLDDSLAPFKERLAALQQLTPNLRLWFENGGTQAVVPILPPDKNSG